jgi:hypothetical protein
VFEKKNYFENGMERKVKCYTLVSEREQKPCQVVWSKFSEKTAFFVKICCPLQNSAGGAPLNRKDVTQP